MTLTTGPSPQPKIMPYLTIIPSRRPEQKIHSNIGHAKNAITGKIGGYGRGAECDMELHEWIEGEWQLRYTIKQGDKVAPWQVGELAEAERKKKEAAKREEDRLAKLVRSQADRKFTEEYGSDSKYEDRMIYVDAYIAGYMQALGR